MTPLSTSACTRQASSPALSLPGADARHADAAAALTAQLTTLSVAAQERATKDAARKAAKASAAEEREASRLASSKVVIRRVERSKRKFVTAVQGLDAFGLDLKRTAKELGKKFATGASVTKVPAGGEEITVQGDLSCEIEDFIVETYAEVPGDNIELVEDKKKKGAGT